MKVYSNLQIQMWMNVLLRTVVVIRTATTQLEATTVPVTIPTLWLWIMLHAVVGAQYKFTVS